MAETCLEQHGGGIQKIGSPPTALVICLGWGKKSMDVCSTDSNSNIRWVHACQYNKKPTKFSMGNGKRINCFSLLHHREGSRKLDPPLLLSSFAWDGSQNDYVAPPKVSPQRALPGVSPQRAPPGVSPQRAPPGASPQRAPPGASPQTVVCPRGLSGALVDGRGLSWVLVRCREISWVLVCFRRLSWTLASSGELSCTLVCARPFLFRNQYAGTFFV